MRILSFFLIMSLFFSSARADEIDFNGQRNIQLKKNQKTTLYMKSSPDRDSAAAADPTECVANGGKNCFETPADEIAPESILKSTDKVTLKDVSEKPVHFNNDDTDYYEVQVVHKNGRVEEGYVNSTNITAPNTPAAPCPQNTVNKNLKDLQTSAKQIESKAGESQKDYSSSLVDLIGPQVGKCLTTPELEKKLEHSKLELKNWDPVEYYSQAYAKHALSPESKEFLDLQNTIKSKTGKIITAEQLADIDLLSRTMYAEMRQTQCSIDPGPGYLKAVARVSLNRVKYKQENPRTQDKKTCDFNDSVTEGFSKDATPLAHTLLSDQQYSGWNKTKRSSPRYGKATQFIETTSYDPKTKQPEVKIISKRVKTIEPDEVEKSLCPPSSANKDGSYYLRESANEKNRIPISDVEQQVWASILDVSINAIIDQEHFLKETSSVSGIYYYTSGRNNIEGYPPISPDKAPIVSGRKLSNKTCMEFYKLPPCFPPKSSRRPASK